MKLNEIHIRDPFILAEGNRYYLYGTRGNGCWDKCKGFDVYISRDLVEWSDPIPVFENYPSFWADRQYWAPEVHKYCGKYYMFASFCAENRHRATQILVSDAPDHMFAPLTENPATPKEWDCLDGTLYISKAGKPYLVYCHEWIQVTDGEMLATELTEDLRCTASDPKLLFKASYPSWATGDINGAYVTDGPFLYRHSDSELFMIWSTQCNGRYVEACAVSDNGEIDGNWLHCDRFLFDDDGGHGMLFTDLNGNLKIVMHQPNVSPYERPAIFDVHVKNGLLSRN